MKLWQPRQEATATWAPRRSRSVRSAGEGAGMAVLTFTGGIGMVLQSSDSRTKRPRSVGEVDTGWASSARKATEPRKPRRGVDEGSVTRSNCVADASRTGN